MQIYLDDNTNMLIIISKEPNRQMIMKQVTKHSLTGCNFCPPARQLAGSGDPETQEVRTGLLFLFLTF